MRWNRIINRCDIKSQSLHLILWYIYIYISYIYNINACIFIYVYIYTASSVWRYSCDVKKLLWLVFRTVREINKANQGNNELVSLHFISQFIDHEQSEPFALLICRSNTDNTTLVYLGSYGLLFWWIPTKELPHLSSNKFIHPTSTVSRHLLQKLL